MSMSVEAGTATDTAEEAEKDSPSNTPEKTLTIFCEISQFLLIFLKVALTSTDAPPSRENLPQTARTRRVAPPPDLDPASNTR